MNKRLQDETTSNIKVRQRGSWHCMQISSTEEHNYKNPFPTHTSPVRAPALYSNFLLPEANRVEISTPPQSYQPTEDGSVPAGCSVKVPYCRAVVGALATPMEALASVSKLQSRLR